MGGVPKTIIPFVWGPRAGFFWKSRSKFTWGSVRLCTDAFEVCSRLFTVSANRSEAVYYKSTLRHTLVIRNCSKQSDWLLNTPKGSKGSDWSKCVIDLRSLQTGKWWNPTLVFTTKMPPPKHGAAVSISFNVPLWLMKINGTTLMKHVSVSRTVYPSSWRHIRKREQHSQNKTFNQKLEWLKLVERIVDKHWDIQIVLC